MTEHDRELDDLVRTFVGDLHALFQKQMRAAFDDVVGAAARPVQPVAATKSVAKATRPMPTAKPPRAAKGGRRSDAEIEKTVARLKEYVTAIPGSRMEHIGAGLGLATKVLTRPMAKLLASNDIRREGEKRATRYFPGGSAPTKTSSAASPKSAAKGKPRTTKASGKQGASAAAVS